MDQTTNFLSDLITSSIWTDDSSTPVSCIIKGIVRQNRRCDSGGTSPNTNHPDNSKTKENPQIQFLDRVVDVPVMVPQERDQRHTVEQFVTRVIATKTMS